MSFSRSNPSPRFQELVKLNRTLHNEGDKLTETPPEKTFYGQSLFPHIGAIKSAVELYQLNTLLDYGCGKASAYNTAELENPDGRVIKGLKDIWGVDKISFYDPAYEPYSELPSGTFDSVICTDVLEHCPEEDIDWIIEELFGFAEKYLIFTIACYPVNKILPNGENAHVTVKQPGWWVNKIENAAAKWPTLQYDVWIDISRKVRALMLRNVLLG